MNRKNDVFPPGSCAGIPRSRPHNPPDTPERLAWLRQERRRAYWENFVDGLPAALWEVVKRVFLGVTFPIWIIPAVFVICWRDEPGFRVGVVEAALSALFWFVVGRLCGWW